MPRFPITSFNAGEVSPQIDARSDVDKYRSGCRTLENMLPRIYGPATRRPGTKYIDTCNGVARVLPFIYSNTISYICLLEDRKMYFYYDGGRVLDSNGRRLSIDTPYLATELFDIQYKQSNDVMWLLHPDHAPMKLTRTSATSFTLTEITFNNGPFQKRHDLAYDDGMTLTPSSTFSVASDDISGNAIAYIASTESSDNTSAAKAFDNRTTGAGCYWQSSVNNFKDQWVGCQFSSGQAIKQVRIAPFAAKPSIGWLDPWAYNPRYINIQASNNGTTWTKVKINGWSSNANEWNDGGAELTRIASPGTWVQLTLDNTTAYTYWRVFVHEHWGGGLASLVVRINEIEFIDTTATWGDDVTLTASESLFDSGHVGALFSLTQQRVDTNLSGSMTYPTTGTTDDILVEGSFTFTTHGTWTGTIALERSVNRQVWETFRRWTSDADTNVQYTGQEDEANVYYRVNVESIDTNTAPGTGGIASKVKYDLSVNSSTQTGIARVTSVTSSTVAAVEVLRPFASTDPTERWAEGSWSDYRGWPRTMTFFESRAVYAYTHTQPQTVWLSGTDDFEDFWACTKDNSSFSLTMSSDTRNAIQWISALEALIVGTTGGEWRIRSSSFDEPLTPTNFSFKQQTSYGSKAIQALPVNDAILFVDYVGRKIREATYDGTKDKYVAPDLTALAEHITESGITCVAFQKNPDPILWATRADGTLLSMTYEREQNVIAWARHPFEVGGGVSNTISGTTQTYAYPVLQELTAAEIPTAPSLPTETTLVGAISVTDAAGLQAMTPGNHYSIDANIDLTGVSWTPLDFDSASDIVIEGNGYTISNLNINFPLLSNQGFIGLIDDVGDVEIRHLNFSNCAVSGGTYSGILAGRINTDGALVINDVDFNNCTVTVGNSQGGMVAGRIEAQKDAYIYNCQSSNCTATSTDSTPIGTAVMFGYLGASADYTNYDMYVSNCHVVSGTVTLATATLSNVGIFCSQMDGGGTTTAPNLHLYECTVSGSLTNTPPSTAANDVSVVGTFAASVNNVQVVSCNSSGTLTLNTNAQWVNSGDELGEIGGFVGMATYASELIDCYSTGDITFPDGGGTPELNQVGGFVGLVQYGNVHMLRCYSTSDLIVQTSLCYLHNVGGFAGNISTSVGGDLVERCWSSGDLTFSGDIAQVYNSGTTGGFVGTVGSCQPGDSATCTNCYTWSSILMTGSTPSLYFHLGGFMGQGIYRDGTEMTVDNCYCAQTNSATGSGLTGQIPAGTNSYGFGSLFGANYGAYDGADIFYDTTTSSVSTSLIGDGHATDWMQTKSNYEAGGWDFDTIWYIPPDTSYSYDISGRGPNSVATIPGESEDEVWLVVARYINGVDGTSVVRYLEQMQPRSVDDQEDMWFIDSALDYDSTATSSVSGLDHLEGEEVYILADGAVQTQQTVSNGAITLAEAASRIIVGLPFRYTLQPMRFDLEISGTTKGTLKRFAEAVISFYETSNAEYGTDTDHLFNIDWRGEETYGTPPALYTGDKVVAHEGGFSTEDPFVVTGNDPLPCTVRAIIPRIDVGGR